MDNKSSPVVSGLCLTASSRSKDWHKRKRTFRKWAKYAILCRSGLRLINMEKNFRRDKNHFKKNTGWFYMEDVLKIDSEISWTVAKYISSNLVHWFWSIFFHQNLPHRKLLKKQSQRNTIEFFIYFFWVIFRLIFASLDFYYQFEYVLDLCSLVKTFTCLKL